MRKLSKNKRNSIIYRKFTKSKKRRSCRRKLKKTKKRRSCRRKLKKTNKRRFKKTRRKNRHKTGGSLGFYADVGSVREEPKLVEHYQKPAGEYEPGEASRYVLSKINFANGSHQCKVHNMLYNPEKYTLETQGFKMFDLSGDQDFLELCRIYSDMEEKGGVITEISAHTNILEIYPTGENGFQIMKDIRDKMIEGLKISIKNPGEENSDYDVSYSKLNFRRTSAGRSEEGIPVKLIPHRRPASLAHIDRNHITRSSVNSVKNNSDFYNTDNFSGFDGSNYNEEDFDLLNIWIAIDGDEGKISNLNLALLDMTTIKPDNYAYASSISYADRSKVTKGGVREVLFTEDIRNAWHSSYPLRIGQGYIFYTDKTPHTAWVDYNKQHLLGRKSLELRVLCRKKREPDEKEALIRKRKRAIDLWMKEFSDLMLMQHGLADISEQAKSDAVTVTSKEFPDVRDQKYEQSLDTRVRKTHPNEYYKMQDDIISRIEIMSNEDVNEELEKGTSPLLHACTIITFTIEQGGSLGINFNADNLSVKSVKEDGILSELVQVGDVLIEFGNDIHRYPGRVDIYKKNKHFLRERPIKLVFRRDTA